MDKPSTIDGYLPEETERSLQLCRYIAQAITDLGDEVTIVGGLVPALSIPTDPQQPDIEPHCGTLDVDMGVSVAIHGVVGWRTVCRRLEMLGFRPDTKQGETRFRYSSPTKGSAFVDLLIASDEPHAPALAPLARIVDPIRARQTALAFIDRQEVRLSGVSINDEAVDCTVLWPRCVCRHQGNGL
jgi:hypothetical protein